MHGMTQTESLLDYIVSMPLYNWHTTLDAFPGSWVRLS